MDLFDIAVAKKLSGGGGGGGGGDSDFSTATVTITNNGVNDLMTFQCFACYEENELGEGSPTMLATYIGIRSGDSATLKVPLYKGLAGWNNAFGVVGNEATVTGDIVNDSGNFYISGDCTITIS